MNWTLFMALSTGIGISVVLSATDNVLFNIPEQNRTLVSSTGW